MQKSKKMKLQGLGLAACSVALVAAVSFGMTGAWFTDTQTTADTNITMGSHVDILSSAANFSPAANDSAHANGTVYMPGDLVSLGGQVVMGSDSSDAFLRIKVNFVDTLGLFDGTGAGLTLQVGIQEISLDGTACYVTEAVKAGSTTDITGTLLLPGDTMLNNTADLGITVNITIDAIQAANRTSDEAGWTNINTTPVSVEIEASV